MKRKCDVCERPFASALLHRVGGRVLCRSCFRWLERHPRSAEPLLESLAESEVRALRRLDVGLTLAGTIAKSLLFLGLYMWAHRSPDGAAVFAGVLVADLLSWFGFTLLDWPFRKVQTAVGTLVQLGLIAFAFHLVPIDEATRSAEGFAAAFVAALFYIGIKGAVWLGETAVELGA